MATTTTRKLGRPNFVANEKSAFAFGTGRQIDWANVGAGYVDATTGKKILPAGTVVGDTLGAGKISPRVVTTNPAMGILISDAVEGDSTAALSGYGVYAGGLFYETLMPDSTGSPKTLAAAIKTELGDMFKFQKWEDSR